MPEAPCAESPIGCATPGSRRGGALPASEPGPGERLPLPGWLVVGATGRNAGKSELACAVIARLHGAHPITGVKVTVIASEESVCPRGRLGCGACTGLDGAYEIREEDGSQPGKDTCRMLESGARAAFWVRCRSGGVGPALAALSPRIDPGTLVVAESNSLVRYARPDLFLMLRPARSSTVKPTAAAVLALAQRVVVSDDGAFDLDLRHLAVLDGTWHLAEASAVILAGGASSRMGADKSLLPVNGTPLVKRLLEQLSERFDDVLVSANDPIKYSFLDARTVPDLVPGNGPLMGIRTAVEAARYDLVFVTACDIPVVDTDTLERLLALAEGYDCVVPRSRLGPEPLFAVYRKSAIPAMRAVLDSGERRIRALFPRVRTRSLDLGTAPWYWNLNTKADLAMFLGSGAGSPSRPGGRERTIGRS